MTTQLTRVNFKIAIASFLLFPSLVFSDENPKIEVGTYAQPIDQSAPKYPRSELARGQEGWAIVNYIVKKDGSVSEAIVEDSNGIPALNRQAIYTVSNWLFKPATLNGEPIEQCHTKVIIKFQIEGVSRGVTRKFSSKHKKILKLIDKNELDEAAERLDKLFDKKGINLFETAWLWLTKATIARKTGDKETELNSLCRAIGGGKDILSVKTYSGALSNKFVLEVDKKLYVDALDTYERISNYSEFTGNMKGIQATVDSINKFAKADTLLGVDGLITDECECDDERRYWNYQILRRKIGFRKIQGKLDNFELRCEWKHFVDKVDIGKAWEVPESWGDCQLVVFGEDNTKFQLVEYPES